MYIDGEGDVYRINNRFGIVFPENYEYQLS